MITTKQYLDKIKYTRADKALVYDYSKTEYTGNDNKLIIICNTHGEFTQRAGDHKRGNGCAKCGREDAKITNLEKYGTTNPASSTIIKDKTKNIFIEKYGVDNPSKVDAIKQQKKETCLQNYGVESPGQSDVIKKKKKITNLERYGVEYPMQNKEISAKGIATKIKRGGFTKSNSSKEATNFIRTYIKNKGYAIEQCAYADADIGLHEWGIHSNGRWILYDLVVFEIGFRGDKNKITEILEYHGPFHYTKEEVALNGINKAYPWKTNNTTIAESYARDVEKEQLGRTMTNNYTAIITRQALQLDPNDVIAENVKKLEARYPGGMFDAHYSENRQDGDL